MTGFAAILALLALPQAAAAQTQTCLTRQELASLFVFAAPSLVDAAAKRCGAELPASAFLRTGGQQLAERWRGEASGDSATVASTFAKLAGKSMPAGVSGETLQMLMRDIVGAEFAKDIKPKDCGKIDQIVAALAPLPVRDVGVRMAGLMELGAGGRKAGPFQMCPDPRP